MARPRKNRFVNSNPEFTYFKPAGVQLRNISDIELSHDEFEALKLVNIDGDNMIEGAIKMGISAPTFNRILNSAYKKITNALVNGYAIKICNNNLSK